MNHVKIEVNGRIMYFLANASLPKPLGMTFTNFAGIYLT